jgi:lipoprotein-anchoring transpeptidase ErfK/SrfK
MQSLKSTFVAVLLLGLSVGLYQISDPSESSVDESLIPAVDISDGSDLLVDETIPATISPPTFEAPASKSPTPPELVSSVGAKPKFSFQASPQPTTTDLVSSSALKVPAPTAENVQSFSYPELGRKDLSDAAKDAALAATDDFRQRQMLEKDRDQGLIDALEEQLKPKPTNEFLADKINAKENQTLEIEPAEKLVTPEIKPEGRYQFASTEPVTPKAQSIGAGDSSVNQLASSRTIDLEDDFNISLANSEPDLASIPLNAAWTQVDRLVADGRYRESLKLLSRFYGTEEADGPQRQRLLGWLDALAGKVIFSSEHHFRDQPYIVAANESLVDLAKRWNVPAQLIYNINRSEISNPASVAPGTALKVVDRPFNATIDLKSNVMTLFCDGLYAGRFPIRIGVSGDVANGTYQVLAKAAEGFRWRDASGNEYPPSSPLNGYGPHWIGLSGSLCMHALKGDATEGHHGCIGLNPTDAADVFQILSQASTVTVVE